MLIDAITWTADPAIFSIFGREVRWYGLFFAVGFLVGYAIEERIYKHDNAPAGWCDKAFIYTIIATIIGAVWVIAYSTVGNITRLTRWTFLKYGKADLLATGEQ